MAAIPYVPTILVDAVIESLMAFLQPFLGLDSDSNPIQIIRGQSNRVPPPPNTYVVVTELFQDDIETPTFTNNGDTEQAQIRTPTRMDIQVDFYGNGAGDWCKAVKAVYRSPYAPDQFPSGIAPLYCDQGHQIPLVTGEEQYQFHWALTCSLQYNPDVFVPQQSATQLETSIFEDIP